MNHRLAAIVSLLMVIMHWANAKPTIKLVQSGQTQSQFIDDNHNFFYPVYTAFRMNSPSQYNVKEGLREWMVRRTGRGQESPWL
jgi:hypothetical protein